MNLSPNIFSPIPILKNGPPTPTENMSSTQEKVTQGQDRVENGQSLKILGASLGGSFSLRRNSAFSIYDPAVVTDDLKIEQEDQDLSFSSQPLHEHPKRTWKREKKDKKELNRLETKNLNRYFRSKINQMLRDIKQNPSNKQQFLKAEKVLEVLNKSNKIMFSQIRDIIKDQWLQTKLLSCTGILLKYIHGGKMGMQSKLIMLKYFNKILKAIRNPDNFTCWK